MSLTGLCFDGEVPLLIMPYMSDGSVLDYVRQNRENLYFTEHSLEEKVVCVCVVVCVLCVGACGNIKVLCSLHRVQTH